LATAQTASGKSAAFVLPAILKAYSANAVSIVSSVFPGNLFRERANENESSVFLIQKNIVLETILLFACQICVPSHLLFH